MFPNPNPNFSHFSPALIPILIVAVDMTLYTTTNMQQVFIQTGYIEK